MTEASSAEIETDALPPSSSDSTPDSGAASPLAASPSSQTDPAGADGKTLATGGDTGTDKDDLPGYWRDDWRERLARGDNTKLARLKRYASPETYADAHFALLGKMQSGEDGNGMPDSKDEAAMAAWRNQMGIPENHEGYLAKVPDGLVFGENDKPALESFLKDMHASDAPPVYVHKALAWYKAHEERQLAARVEADRAHRITAEDSLRSEWGPEFRANINGVNSMMETYGGNGLADRLFGARLADGTPLGDDPDFLRFLVSLDKQVNPHGTIPTPDSPAGMAMTNEREIIRKAMSDRNSDYWRGPKDASGETQMARRYRELLEIDGKRR